MDVLFRTDASIAIGTGHVMRCVTLAKALREKGACCRFVCREHSGNLVKYISQSGFEVLTLSMAGIKQPMSAESETDPAHAAWLGTDWRTDAQQTIDTIVDIHVDWLIVDHYSLSACWERALRPMCRHLMIIDDLADREHDCDLLLDQNLGRERINYVNRVPENCSILTGSKYAMLRPEFAALRQRSLKRRVTAQSKHLLISMGGIDKDNATGQVLEALKGCHLPVECCITVVMGYRSLWLTQVRDVAAQMPWPTEVLVNVQDMARLMAESDFAIGAAGGTSWERLCLSLPTLLVLLSDNQNSGAVAMEAVGSVLLIGNIGSIAQNLGSKLENLLFGNNLCLMQHACSALVDGNGINRIVKFLTDWHD